MIVVTPAADSLTLATADARMTSVRQAGLSAALPNVYGKVAVELGRAND